MMDNRTIIKIKKKFGSFHNFARRIGMDVLNGKSLAEINAIALRLTKSNSAIQIRPAQIEALRKALYAFGGVEAFCAKHKQFSKVSIHQILQGRRKRVSHVVRALFDHFKI